MAGEVLTKEERFVVEAARATGLVPKLCTIIDRLARELEGARGELANRPNVIETVDLRAEYTKDLEASIQRAGEALGLEGKYMIHFGHQSIADRAMSLMAALDEAQSDQGVCEAFEVLCDSAGIKEVQFFGPPHDDRAFVEVCKHNAASMPPGFRETMKREDWATKSSLAEAVAALDGVNKGE